MFSISTRILGVLLTLASVVFGLITGAIVKDLAQELPVLITLWYRFLFSLPLLFAIAISQRGIGDWLQINNKQVLIIRIAFGFSGIVFWFLSVRTIPLGQATALFQSSVLFITMLSPLFLGERVGIYRSAAVVIGLVGIFIITDALYTPPSLGIIFAICAAVSGSGLSICLRKLGKSEVPATVASWYNFTGFLLISLSLVVVPQYWVWPDSEQFLKLIALGVIASLLQFSMTTAYRYSEAVVVSSLRYLQVLGAGVVGYFMFAEIPTALQLFGAFIVVSSCLFIVLREFQLSKR